MKNNANQAPSDTMEAQYSIPYCCAVALSNTRIDARAVVDAVSRLDTSPSVQALTGILQH